MRSKFDRVFFYNSFVLDQLIKTGCRFDELKLSKWKAENETTFSLESSKHSNIRVFDISEMNELYAKDILEHQNKLIIPCYSTFLTQFKIASEPNFFYQDKKDLEVHIIRHIYIKNLYSKLSSSVLVMQKLGHKSLSTTMKYILSDIKKK